jgi:succinate-semialdehyde dehydrogenase/glutarate-semialdehyde dehydrogenase
MAIATTSPATGETVQTFDELSDDLVRGKLQRAADAFAAYRATTFTERGQLLSSAADILDAESEQLARIATLEMGKTYASAVAELKKCSAGCRWYAEYTAEILADRPYEVPDATVYTRYEPLGPILAVMPWNFPYWQVFRFAAPALMAGNVVLLKHASNVPRVALAIEDLLHRAGFAEGVFQTLLVGSGAIDAIVDDERVRGVTLTGSEAAGRAVGAAAGRNVKTSVLELGGSDAFIVMPSADIAAAVKAGVASRMLNNGQSCINAKRFIVHADIADEFERRMVAAMEELTVGDPMDENTDLGPLSSADAVQTLDRQVRDTVAAGARVLTGGAPLDGPGNYYPPTVLTDIPDGSPADEQELFGPVASVWRVGDVDEAIRVANDSRYGLGASAWTGDHAEQQRFVAEIESGMVYVNAIVESTPGVPFGGTKSSGYGRELAHFGPRSFVNAKTVWVAR